MDYKYTVKNVRKKNLEKVVKFHLKSIIKNIILSLKIKKIKLNLLKIGKKKIKLNNYNTFKNTEILKKVKKYQKNGEKRNMMKSMEKISYLL